MSEDLSATEVQRPRRRRWFVVSSVVVALVAGALALGLALSGGGSQSAALVGATGGRAPTFALPSLVDSRTQVSLAQFRGKPLVLNFWASDCPPCRTEMPLLQSEFESRHGAVSFLGIDTLDSSTAALSFLAQVHTSYPVAVDSSGAVATKYGVYGIPTTVFVSASGRIAGRHIGQLDASTLERALSEAFPRT
ncbi:MAG TPA: TlpA disulfide reductase family protein [Acidimicrobiales bacterium]|nr:TlpA disulfide reductase family protein [Acidimicrobiales bacterium]